MASGILVIHKKVLLIQRAQQEEVSPKEWGIPCGHVEQGETPEEAVVREFFEETGVRVKNPKFIRAETYFFDMGKVRTYITECMYEVHPQTINMRIVLDKEHAAYQFASRHKLKLIPSLLEPRKQTIKSIIEKH